MYYATYYAEVVDVEWKYGEAHMWDSHQVAAQHANEALNDPDAVWFDPDPTSKSGIGVRVIGYSHSLDEVLTVIVLHRDKLGDEVDTDAQWVGSNGWKSKPKERRIYREEQS